VAKLKQNDDIGSKGEEKIIGRDTTTRHRIYMALVDINIILSN
jgi:hypothetical protein